MRENFDIIVTFMVMVFGAMLFSAWLFSEAVTLFFFQLGRLTITAITIFIALLIILLMVWIRAKMLMWWEHVQQAKQNTAAMMMANKVREAEIAMHWAKVNMVQAKIQAVEVKAKTDGYLVEHIKPNERLLIGQGDNFQIVNGFERKAIPVLADGTPDLITGEDNEALAYTRGQAWIRDFLFDDYGQLKVYHVKTDGPTGVGKTFLMLHMIWLLQAPHPAAEYWLCDPKFEGEGSGWPFQPFVADFDEVATGAQYLYDNIVTARKHAKRAGTPPLHPAFLLFDEADGCFDEHGDNFSKPVRRIIKEGRSGWTHCFVIGQSPLAKDVGFSGSLFRNTARLVMGNEALAFLRNAQFSFWEKDYRDKLKKQLMYLQEHGKRYTLAIPPSGQGLPFVAEIPRLDKPNFVNLAQLPQKPLTTLLPEQAAIHQNNKQHTILNGRVGAEATLEQEDPQFISDLQVVMGNVGKVRYRKGRPVKASICEILNLPDGGREYIRVQAIAEHLEKHNA